MTYMFKNIIRIPFLFYKPHSKINTSMLFLAADLNDFH